MLKHVHDVFLVPGYPLAELLSLSMRVAADNDSTRTTRSYTVQQNDHVAYSPPSSYGQVHTPQNRKLTVKLIISLFIQPTPLSLTVMANVSLWCICMCVVNYFNCHYKQVQLTMFSSWSHLLQVEHIFSINA